MRVYWRYLCDYGHSWTIFRDDNAQEQPEDILCPHGHEAVTLHKDYPVDEVGILLRPAAYIGDPIRNRVYETGKYWFILTDYKGEALRVSEQSYLWREVMKLAERFHGHSKESAWSIWDSINP